MLKVSRAPLRISFTGGGSDYPEYFRNYGTGIVIGTSINAWVYVTALPLHASAEEKIRFTYRVTQSVRDVKELDHPAMKEILGRYLQDLKINFATFATLPGNSGLGSSSAFSVASIGLLTSLQRKNIDKDTLAREAIEIERVALGEKGGWQDQFHSAIGGFRSYKFSEKSVSYSEFLLSDHECNLLSKNLLLVKVGNNRASSDQVSKNSTILSSKKISYLDKMVSISLQLERELKSRSLFGDKFDALVESVNESWNLKTKLTLDNDQAVYDLIDFGKSKGAASAKLCGAGGSGFVLFLYDSSKYPEFDSEFGENIFNPAINSYGYEDFSIL